MATQEKETLEKIKTKVIKLCQMHNKDDDVMNFYFQKIDEYLSYENSSLDMIDYFLNNSFDNGSWMIFTGSLLKEIDKMTGKYQREQEEQEKERQRILLDYKPIELGERFLNEEELSNLTVDLGLIDAFGVYHTSKRSRFDKRVDHRQIAEHLALSKKIIQYYIRVGCIVGQNDGILSAESLYYGNKSSLKNFILNEQMALALYNGIRSKKSPLSTFEEKLALYGTEYGYYSTKYNVPQQIYDRDLFDNNMKVLSYTLGKRFDRNFFTDVLNK